MENTGSKEDFESAPQAPTEAVNAPPRNRPAKRREPLHAFIVHFDAEPSSKPLPADYPDPSV